MNEKNAIYVVQSRSGIVLTATSDYEKAKNLKDELDNSKHDKGYLSTWINGKHVPNN